MITLFYSTSKWPFSWIVRLVTWSKYSHVAIVDGDFIIEAALWFGVRRRSLAVAIEHARCYEFVRFESDDPIRIINLAKGQIGKPYDWLALIGIWLHRDWQTVDKWFCSELVAWAFDKASEPLFSKNVLNRVVPQHLLMLNQKRKL